MTIRNTVFFALAFVGFFFYSNSAAAEVDCYRSYECDHDLICMDLQCVESDMWLELCDSDADCSGYRVLCDEGYCKKDGVSCRNEAGQCSVDTYWGGCECESGMGTDWEGKEPSDASDEELYGQCVDSLIEMCGEEEPDISDYCNEEELDICVDLLLKVHELEETCDPEDGDEPDSDSDTSGEGDEDGEDGEDGEDDEGGDSDDSSDPSDGSRGDPGFSELKDCCEALGDEIMQDFIDCIMDLEAENCDGFEECLDIWGDGEPADDDSGGGDFDDGEEDEDGDPNDDETGSDDESETSDAGEQETSVNAGGLGCGAAPTKKATEVSLMKILAVLAE